MTARRAVAALALAAALPALAYVLPPAAILRRLGERRAALELSALEVTGTVQLLGPAADRLASVGVPRPPGGELSAPARFLMKIPGRCRLELALPEVAEAARPFVAVRDGAVTGRGGLDAVPAAVALVRSTCALIGQSTQGDATDVYASVLARRGVALTDASLGRFDGRIAYVIGGRERDAKPLLFVDKDGFQPLRLVSPEGGALQDVRLLGWGSNVGGDWFPRAVEVLEGGALRLRFTTDHAQANPKIADGMF
ncbi:hypothetical protein [Anaeromyxobacter oryzae]|uniref:Uncharacterized protein n=1 Tax=Anaeromyxobacter oryzae TaxID=2918170 RepID=A0ABN6MMB6_9BACT|nr:hypothetical protein [Anaeromyxobacter oryzae]BDG02184.1 hypothetical protein AMOR_11800 [Anaeromyxobacter oryzae]